MKSITEVENRKVTGNIEHWVKNTENISSFILNLKEIVLNTLMCCQSADADNLLLANVSIQLTKPNLEAKTTKVNPKKKTTVTSSRKKKK